MNAAETSSTPLVEARRIAKRYGSLVALAEMSLSISTGEMVAIVGPNGCGKSTLLRILAGVDGESGAGHEVLEGRAGEVHLGGGSKTRIDAARVRAFVPQRPDVSAAFTARDVVRLGRFARGASEAAVARALASVGLTARADLDLQTLSGGERQRIAVARALAQVDGAAQPLILLDEPFSGIDPGEVARIVTVLRAISKVGAVVLSLHDPGLARMIATRAIVMHRGHVVADGPVHATLTPATLSAAYEHSIVQHADWLAPELPQGDTMGT